MWMSLNSVCESESLGNSLQTRLQSFSEMQWARAQWLASNHPLPYRLLKADIKGQFKDRPCKHFTRLALARDACKDLSSLFYILSTVARVN